jgi:DNA-binding transcriptional regulator YiaG
LLAGLGDAGRQEEQDHEWIDMSKIGSLLKEEMLRLARKEARVEVRIVKKASAQHRRDIAELKRRLRNLTLRLSQHERRACKEQGAAPAGAAQDMPKFSAKRLRSHRRRLGLSAADYARLVGVTQLSIYNWERGVARPRQEWLQVLAALRELTKKEAQARLEKLANKPAKRRRRS